MGRRQINNLNDIHLLVLVFVWSFTNVELGNSCAKLLGVGASWETMQMPELLPPKTHRLGVSGSGEQESVFQRTPWVTPLHSLRRPNV